LGGTVGRHVLLIEDEANIAEAIRFILSRDGWQVSHLSTGTDAVAQACALQPDLIVLDHMLPGMSGLDILRELKANPETSSIPVMMLTAKSQGRDREAATLAGADRFMTKPFSNSEILAELRGMIGE
jgi:DNA-binding response OmpR family regulator